MTRQKAEVALRTAAYEFVNTPESRYADDREGAAANRKLLRAAVRLGGMTKRQYSRDFTPKTERRVQMVIDRIPPTLYDAVKAKAKREGVSLRALVLGWLKEWVEK